MTREQVFELYKDAGTLDRNLCIYYFGRAHSENGHTKRGVFARLGRALEPQITRERVRKINDRMISLMEGK